MKSHKKLFSFVLVFALILSTVVLFNGCGGESAKEMFNKASKNMEKAKSVKSAEIGRASCRERV